MTVGALFGLVFGAIAGLFGTLLVAQRTERRAAESGEQQTLDALRDARRLYRQHLNADVEYWWDSDIAPSLPDWDALKAALVAQISAHDLDTIEAAVTSIAQLN